MSVLAIPYASLYEKVQIILKNKIEEFHYFGYNSITEQELWEYCINKTWRKRDIQSLRLYELTSGILNVSASEIINYLQVNGLKQNLFEVEISNDELSNLFQQLPSSLSENNEK